MCVKLCLYTILCVCVCVSLQQIMCNSIDVVYITILQLLTTKALQITTLTLAITYCYSYSLPCFAWESYSCNEVPFKQWVHLVMCCKSLQEGQKACDFLKLML